MKDGTVAPPSPTKRIAQVAIDGALIIIVVVGIVLLWQMESVADWDRPFAARTARK